MKKLTILAVAIVFLMACNSENTKESSSEKGDAKQVEQEKTQKPEFVLAEGDTLFFENENFRVVGKEKTDYMGFLFKIYDLSTDKSFDYAGGETDALWYNSVFKNYLLIDAGSDAQHYSFIVVDMKNNKVVKHFDYIVRENAGLEGDKFTYWVSLDELPADVEKPNCEEFEGVPEDMLGYVEEWILDLNTMESEKTNNYECIYFQ